jgi:adenosyl cobinamide kinase/adenosyl cobinamide phosphate guanylyltransferase
MPKLGDTLVPLIFISDGTYLSKFAGDKKEWPVYMTIVNLTSKIRQMPSAHTVVMVALLPLPIKNHNSPQKRFDEQQQTNREVLNEVLQRILQPVIFKQNPYAQSLYYNVLCADGNFRYCKPV